MWLYIKKRSVNKEEEPMVLRSGRYCRVGMTWTNVRVEYFKVGRVVDSSCHRWRGTWGRSIVQIEGGVDGSTLLAISWGPDALFLWRRQLWRPYSRVHRQILTMYFTEYLHVCTLHARLACMYLWSTLLELAYAYWCQEPQGSGYAVCDMQVPICMF